MKKLKKLLLITVLALVGLGVLAIIIVALFLDTIVKKGVETVGSRVAQVSVTVDAVHLSPLSGGAKVKGLVVGNPTGYKDPDAIRVGQAEVTVVPGSLLGDKVIVKDVSVDGPEITFEGGLTDNNLTKIQSNVNDFMNSLGGAADTNLPASTKPKGTARKLEVDHFQITNAKLHGSFRIFGKQEVSLPALPLPTIELDNLGTGPDGITAAELVKDVLHAITTASIKTVGSAATGLGKGAINAGQSAGQDVGKGVNTITKGIGSLFGK